MSRGSSISSKSALLVIDMQKEFSPTADSILSEVNETISSARRAGLPVIFTQHGHLDPVSDQHSSVLVRWWGVSGSIKKGSRNWELLPNLDVTSTDTIIDEKSTYDAFYRTRLKSLLDEQQIDTVIIAGVLTQYCCETTARSAFVQNYNVVFLSDGTGPACQGTLEIIATGFGTVLSCAELRRRLKKISAE